MLMKKYEVEVRIGHGFIGETRKIVVEAKDVADAIVQVALKLDDEGHDRFKMLSLPFCIEN